jgi:hypothetical protein
MLMFQNTLSVPSSEAGRCEEWTGFEKCWGNYTGNVGVIIREKVWLENSLSQTFSRRHIKFRRRRITQKKAHNKFIKHVDPRNL